MSNQILNSLLKEYEQKKLKAELDLEKRKEELYQKIPELEKIENELNHFAIQTARNILSDSSSSLDDLKQKVDILKYRKACILQEANLPNDYLKPIYECPICKDTGYIMGKDYKTIMCNCLKQKLLDFSFHKSNMSLVWIKKILILLMKIYFLMKLMFQNIILIFLQGQILKI